MKKVAELNQGRALSLLLESPWSGSSRLQAISGYVKGIGTKVDWRNVIADLKTVESHERQPNEEPRLSPGVEVMVAGVWGKSDLEASMHWFVDELGRDFSDPTDSKEIISALWHLPLEDRYQMVDWLVSRQTREGWHDRIITEMGEFLVHQGPDTDTGRLAALITQENERLAFVLGFLGEANGESQFNLRHSPDDLKRLVTAAKLSPGTMTELQNMIASSKWVGPK